MAINLSSIGVKISYATEATAGTRPTTGYTLLPSLKEFPETDNSPNTADATTFDDLEYTSYVALLKDFGGALTVTGNMTQALKDAWGAMCEADATARTSGKRTWICVDIPGIDEAGFLPVEPVPMGLPALTANALVEKNLYIVPQGGVVMAAKPTYA